MFTRPNASQAEGSAFRPVHALLQFLRSTVAGLLLASAAIGSVHAGDFFERDGVAIDGFDPVAYFTENKAIKGDAQWETAYKDSVFHFSSAKNRDLFAASPQSYAPQFDGFCAYGVAQGAKVKIEGDLFAIVDNKLYLNYDESVQASWNKDRAGFIEQANENWPSLK